MNLRTLLVMLCLAGALVMAAGSATALKPDVEEDAAKAPVPPSAQTGKPEKDAKDKADKPAPPKKDDSPPPEPAPEAPPAQAPATPGPAPTEPAPRPPTPASEPGESAAAPAPAESGDDASGPASVAPGSDAPPVVGVTGSPEGPEPILSESGSEPLRPSPFALANTQAATPVRDVSGRASWLPFALGIGAVGITSLGLLKRSRPLPAPARPMDAFAPDASAALREGQAAVTAGQLDAALLWFDEALRHAPDLAVAHFCKGLCLREKQELVAARDAFETACARDPTDGLGRVHLAAVYARLGDSRASLAALAPIVTAAPEIGARLADDADFASMRDHPMFLAMVGRL